MSQILHDVYFAGLDHYLSSSIKPVFYCPENGTIKQLLFLEIYCSNYDVLAPAI